MHKKKTHRHRFAYLLLTSPIVHSYVLCIISQPWYSKTIMHVHLFVMSQVFSLYTHKQNTLSAQLCSRLAQLCIMYHGLYSVICSLYYIVGKWITAALQFHGFLKNEALIKTKQQKLSLVPTFSSKRVNVVPWLTRNLIQNSSSLLLLSLIHK